MSPGGVHGLDGRRRRSPSLAAARRRAIPPRPRAALGSLLAAALAVACGPASSTPNVPVPAAPSGSHAVAPPPGDVLPLQAVPVPLPGRYTAAHGKLFPGIVTPWAAETASVLGLDAAALATAVGVTSTAPGRVPVILASPAHRTGDFTYALGDATRVYQISPVETATFPRGLTAVLAAAGPPDAQIIDVFEATWILGLVERAPPPGGGQSAPGEGPPGPAASGPLGPAATVLLRTKLPPAKGLWDVIDTSLSVDQGKLAVLVNYGHAGGGEPCDRGFSFVVRAEAGPRLVVERTAVTRGPCAALGEMERD